MIEQVFLSRFYLKSRYVAVDPSGTEVCLPNRDDLIYRKGGEEMVLRADFDFIADVFFTTHVFLPERYVWNSGRELVGDEIENLKIDIRDGLAAFESLVLFKTPQWVREMLAPFEEVKARHG